MRYLLTLLFVGFIVTFADGCVFHTGEDTANSEQNEQEIFGEEMLDALSRKDYPRFINNFSVELKDTVPKEAFEKLCEELNGRRDSLSSWRLLDTLDRGGIYRTELWKVTIKRVNAGKESMIDRLFYVTGASLNGKEVVIGFKFDTLF